MRCTGFVFVLFLSTNSFAISSNEFVYTRVTDVYITPTSEGFEFEITAEIWNKFNQTVTITSPDLCRLRFNITATTDDRNIGISVHQCGVRFAREGKQEFEPGITIELKNVMITFQNYTNPSRLPDGVFEIRYGENIDYYKNLDYAYAMYLYVEQGRYNFEEEPYPDDWPIYSIAYKLPLSLFIFPLVLFVIRRKKRKSPECFL